MAIPICSRCGEGHKQSVCPYMHPKTILDTCNDNIKKASVSLIFEGRKNSGLFSTIIGLLSNETLYCKYCEEIYNKIKN